MVKAKFEDGTHQWFDNLSKAKQHMRQLGLHEGAAYINQDGKQVVEYWNTAEAANTEQNTVSPASIVCEAHHGKEVSTWSNADGNGSTITVCGNCFDVLAKDKLGRSLSHPYYAGLHYSTSEHGWHWGRCQFAGPSE